MKIVVLGGTGQMSKSTIRDLAASPDVQEVIVAGRNMEKAERVAAANGAKCKAVKCDVMVHEEIIDAIRGADCVINCCTYKVNLNVMRACLEVGTHYTDLGGLFHTTQKQMELNDEFKKAGLTAVLSMGGTPGTMNVLARYAVDRLDTVEEIRCLNGCGDWSTSNEIFSVPYSISTIMEEFTTNPIEYINGDYIPVDPRSGNEIIDFGPPLGAVKANYTIHSEMATMPVAWKDKGVKNVCFKLGLPTDFEEKVCFLADIGFSRREKINVKGVEVAPVDVLEAMLLLLPKDQNAVIKDCDILRAEVIGMKDGVKVQYVVNSIARESKLYNCSSTELNTGVPPSIVAQMIVRGDVKERGAYGSEKGVDPEIFFAELAKRQMYVTAALNTPMVVKEWDVIKSQYEV